MKRPANPHDRFFRKIGADPLAAAGMVESFLPADIRPLVDLSSLEAVKDSFVSEGLRAYYSDLLFRVRLAGTPGCLFFLFEHKSYPDRFVHNQLLKYVQRAWESQTGADLPPVIPILIYGGTVPWPYDPRFSRVFPGPDPALSRFFPDFELILADLSRYPDEEICGAVLARVFLLLLKHVRSPDFSDRMPGIFRLLKDLERSRTGLGHLEAMVRYVVGVAENIPPETVASVVADLVPGEEGVRIMTTLAERWKQEGMSKGLEKGLAKGMAKGLEKGLEKGMKKGKVETLHAALEDGLQAKFGDAGRSLAPKIRGIEDADRLRNLLRELWTVSDLAHFATRIEGDER